jgi:hypothetical protein
MQMGPISSGYSANRNLVARVLFCVTGFTCLRDVVWVAIEASALVMVLLRFARVSL